MFSIKIIYIILIVVAVVLIVADVALNFNRKKLARFKPRKDDIGNNVLIKWVHNSIDKYRVLKDMKLKYANKLCLVSKSSKKENEEKIEEFILITLVVSLLIGILVMKFFSMWYIFVFAVLLSVFTAVYLGITLVGMKLSKVYAFFPTALQQFTDEYVTYKNIKLALDNSYSKMPTQISKVFENLARRFASETDYSKVIADFADGLDFTWGYAFAEILQLSYEGAGDISDDLIYLSELSSEQIRSNLETDTALSGTKMLFLMLNGFTMLGFVLNIIFMPLAKELYFYTQVGNSGLIFWGLSFSAGLVTLAILKKV